MASRPLQRSLRRVVMKACRVASLAAALLAALPGTSRAWQAHFGSHVGAYSAALSVAIDGERNMIAAGIVDATGDFIGYATVVKLAPDGSPLWRTAVDARGSWAERVFIDSHGDVLVGGRTNVGDETDTGQPSAFKLAGATGAVLWRHTDPLSSHINGRVLADPEGNVLLEYYARYEDDYTIGKRVCRKVSGHDGSLLWQNRHCSTLLAVDQSGDLYVGTCSKLRKLSAADGHELWRTRVPLTACGDPQFGHRPVAIDLAGDVVLAGGDSAAKVSGVNGALVWTTRLHALSTTFFSFVTIDAAGDVVLAGSTASSSRSSDVLVAKLTGGDGRRRWQRRLDGQEPAEPPYPFYPGEAAHGVTINAQGDVVVIARLHRRGLTDAVIKLDGEHGRRIWVRPVVGHIVDVATDSSDAIALAGTNELPANDPDAAFGFWVAQLSPDGDGLTPPLLY